jgi:integrating conjugative element protein (TIGR03752 family)
LLGIVPNEEGSVLDPIRFKLITGPENLATNGHFIPGIRDIVWSGVAIGNREMSCVRGEVHSVTFTFDDGRVYTQSSTRDGDTKTTNIRKILGYISDTRGKPCLTGELITNAEDYLKDRMIAAGVGATADSFAQTQETTTVSEGVSQTFFTGDQGEFIAAATLSGSLKELTDYLRDRQRNAVDLVYLDGGQDVVLHVEDEITIDYLTKGRKLDYASQIPTQQTTAVSYFD